MGEEGDDKVFLGIDFDCREILAADDRIGVREGTRRKARW